MNFLQASFTSDHFLLSEGESFVFLKKRERFSIYFAQDFAMMLAQNSSTPLTTFLSPFEKNQLASP